MSALMHHTKKQRSISSAAYRLTRYTGGAAILLSVISALPAKADYESYTTNPAEGYVIRLNASTTLSDKPFITAEGKQYYQIGQPVILSLGGGNVTVTGQVKCLGHVYPRGSNGGIYGPASGAFYTFGMTGALQRELLSGDIIGYHVSKNLVVGIDYSISTYWKSATINTCAGSGSNIPSVVNASDFNQIFPLRLTFYLVNKPVDNQIYIPQTDLGGLRMYYSSLGSGYGPIAPSPSTPVPMSEMAVPLRLAASIINIPSSCKTSTSSGTGGALEIRHGKLNSMNYDSTINEKVTYTCNFSALTNIRLRLDYTGDTDPKNRLPLVNTADKSQKIYSELTMTNNTNGQTGKEIRMDVRDSQSVTISSHLKGTNATPGHYQGVAWLIATYD